MRAALSLFLFAAACTTQNAAPPAAAARDSIVAMARLEPAGKVVRAAASEEGVIERLVVSEGDTVAAGAPIAYLASHALRKEEVRAAELKVERGGLGPFDIEAQEARVRLAEAEAAQYKADVERQQTLVDSGLVPGKQLDASRLLARRAEEQAAGARADLRRIKGSSGLAVEEARNELARARILLARTVVASPIDGTILKLLARPGERISGAVAQIGAVLAMTAVAEVHANDIHLVKVGQKASFSSPALPGPVEGSVSQIGSMIGKNNVFGEDPSAPDNARVFQVTVALADSSAAARFTNLEGQIKILIRSER